VKTQESVLSKQLQAARLGVGGSVVEATNSSLLAGQAGYFVVPAELLDGLFGGETLVYCASRPVKSSLVVTVVPSADMLTRPNSPAALSAGK